MMGQEVPMPHCPRCGGPMYQPAGSSFYWHATNNHPPCSITSIVEIPKSTPTNDERSDGPAADRPGPRNTYS